MTIPVRHEQLVALRQRVDELAPIIGPDVRRHLSARARRLLRPPRVAVVGEFSAGKSTLINLLLGNYVLPTSVVPTTLVPTLLRHASRPQARLVMKDGTSSPVPFERLTTMVRAGDALDGLQRIDIALPAARLRNVEILDTPGLSDPELDPDLVFEALRRVDSCIWCTLATQAWRHTEQSSWTRVDAAVRRRSILAITHADALNTVAERKKVFARVRTAAKGEFAAVLMMSLSQAISARSGSSTSDKKHWKNSGYPALEQALDRVVQVSARRRLRRQLERLIEGLARVTPVSGQATAPPGREAALEQWNKTGRQVLELGGAKDWADGAAALIAGFRHAALPPASTLSAMFACDAATLRASALEGEAPEQTLAAVVAQLGAELAEGVGTLEPADPDRDDLASVHAEAMTLARDLLGQLGQAGAPATAQGAR